MDLSQLDSIQSLDTARMALRWALERLHALDREKADGQKRLAQTERRSAAAAVRAVQAELHYARMEGWIFRELSEKLGLSEAPGALQGQLAALERELARGRESLERERRESEAAGDAAAAQELGEALKALQARQEKIAWWEEAFARHETLEEARGDLVRGMRKLRQRLTAEAPAPEPPSLEPAEARGKSLPAETPPQEWGERLARQEAAHRRELALQKEQFERRIRELEARAAAPPAAASPAGAPAPHPERPAASGGVLEEVRRLRGELEQARGELAELAGRPPSEEIEEFRRLLREREEQERSRAKLREEERAAERAKAAEEMGRLRHELEGVRREHGACRIGQEAVLAERDRALGQAERLRAELERLGQEYAAYQAEQSLKLARLESAPGGMEALQEKAGQLAGKVFRLESELEKARGEIRRLRAELETRSAPPAPDLDQEALRSELEAALQSAGAGQERAEQLLRERERALRDAENLRRELGEARAEPLRLHAELDAALSRVRGLESELADARAALAAVRKQPPASSADERVAELERRLAERETELHRRLEEQERESAALQSRWAALCEACLKELRE